MLEHAALRHLLCYTTLHSAVPHQDHISVPKLSAGTRATAGAPTVPHHQLSCPLFCRLCPAALPARCLQGLPADGSPSCHSPVSTWVGSCFATLVLQHCSVMPQGSPPEGPWDDSAAPAEPTHSTSLCFSCTEAGPWAGTWHVSGTCFVMKLPIQT